MSDNVSLDGVIQDPAGDEGFGSAAGSASRSGELADRINITDDDEIDRSDHFAFPEQVR